MSERDDILDSEHARPGYLWQIGYEHLTESVERADSISARITAEQQAALFFAASQARSLALLAELAPALVEQQRLANILAALADNPGESIFVYNTDDDAALEYIRAGVHDIVNPAPAGDAE